MLPSTANVVNYWFARDQHLASMTPIWASTTKRSPFTAEETGVVVRRALGLGRLAKDVASNRTWDRSSLPKLEDQCKGQPYVALAADKVNERMTPARGGG